MGRRNSADKAARAFNDRLRQGGQRIKITGRADLYERRGKTLEQINGPSAPVKTRAILSNRIHLSNHLRGVGNVYGASVEEAQIGLSGEFLPEIVDGGQNSAGGITPHLVAVAQRVRIAQDALSSLPQLRHRASAEKTAGPHRVITSRQLMDRVCIQGADVAEVALVFGWYTRREGKAAIPKQQSQKLKAGLVEALEAVDDAWREAGIDITRLVGGVEVGWRCKAG